MAPNEFEQRLFAQGSLDWTPDEAARDSEMQFREEQRRITRSTLIERAPDLAVQELEEVKKFTSWLKGWRGYYFGKIPLNWDPSNGSSRILSDFKKAAEERIVLNPVLTQAALEHPDWIDHPEGLVKLTEFQPLSTEQLATAIHRIGDKPDLQAEVLKNQLAYRLTNSKWQEALRLSEKNGQSLIHCLS